MEAALAGSKPHCTAPCLAFFGPMRSEPPEGPACSIPAGMVGSGQEERSLLSCCSSTLSVIPEVCKGMS